MKKNILLTALVITCMAMALPAFATTSITTGNTTQIGGANFVPSTNVSLSATSGPATGPTAYSVTSVHASSLVMRQAGSGDHTAAAHQRSITKPAPIYQFSMQPPLQPICRVALLPGRHNRSFPRPLNSNTRGDENHFFNQFRRPVCSGD